MNEREQQMAAAMKVMLKAQGGEIRLSASEMAADKGVVAMMPADEDDMMLLKRFDCIDDATAAVRAAEAKIRGEAI